jgi:dihydropteroate synthase
VSRPIDACSSPARSWRIAPEVVLALARPIVMGVVNATPDSFSDGGRHGDPRRDPGPLIDHALRLVAEGADLIDVGAESTRPGAARVDGVEQIARAIPVIRGLAARTPAPICIDTTLADVAAAAIDAGASILNDVSAGTEDEGMLPLAARRGAAVILMHRLRPPERDCYSHEYDAPPRYGDVVADVLRFLLERAAAAERAGVPRDAIAIDPGLGFGKSVEQNFALIAATAAFVETGFPVVAAASRKSFIGRASGVDDPAARVAGSLAAAVVQFLGGAQIFRAHDVAAHREALGVAAALRSSGAGTAGFCGRHGWSVEGAATSIYDPARELSLVNQPGSDGRPGPRPRRPEPIDMASAAVKEFTDTNFDAEVLKAKTPVLVDFWAEWCQPCRLLSPTIDAMAKEYSGRATVGKVDTDANMQVAARYGISSIPTVLLFKNGEVAKKFVGLTSKDKFASALDELLK